MEQQNNETESASTGSPGDSHDSNHPQDPGGCDIPVESQNNEKESTSMTGHGDSPDSSHQQDEVKTKEADHEVDSLVADQTDSRSNSKMSADRDSVQDKEMPNKSQQEEPPPVDDSSPNSESAESRSTQDSSTETEETRTHPVSDGNSSQSPGGVTEKNKEMPAQPADGKALSAHDQKASSDSKSESAESSTQQESKKVKKGKSTYQQVKELKSDQDQETKPSSTTDPKTVTPSQPPNEDLNQPLKSDQDQETKPSSTTGPKTVTPSQPPNEDLNQPPIDRVTPPDSSQFWIILFIVSVLVAFSAIVLVYWLGADVPPPAICNSQDRENCSRFFEENIHRLQEMYPKQDKNLWLTLYSAAVLHVLQNQKPIRPITVLVYSLSEDSKIIEEVSDLYETVLAGEKKNGKIVLDGSELSGKDPEEVHRIIAGSLEEGFQSRKKVAVVRDFDLLPSCSVLAFHNYCNNDDAPYLDVAIILTIRGTVDVGKAPKAKDLERTVGDILHKKWKDCPDDLPPDKIDAILSRIANNVVLVR